MPAKKKTNKKQPRLGAHFSIAGGLEKALYTAADYGCTALQIFTKNANSWKERVLKTEEIVRFEDAKKKTGITAIAAHTSYLINLAAPDPKKNKLSCQALSAELKRSSQLGIPFVVLHPGAHMESGVSKGLKKITANINRIFKTTSAPGTMLLLETTAGQGTGLGHVFEELADIIEGVQDKSRIGVCLDTSHIFAAGYDIRTRPKYLKTLRIFNVVIGLEKLKFIHLNDSKKEFCSRVDRHEHIGKGKIGPDAFRFFMNDRRLSMVPKILETPKGDETEDFDKMNLRKLRSLISK